MPNHLNNETSPYLQQHVNNPVDWYPWSDEALAKARREDKPILLSIGYSACHWCHVMAHESFEDDETAAIMNKLFVNIKVDREERPDLDKIYQIAQQLLTNKGGGWPLTVFLTPEDQVPFFAGTYFPKVARYQLPAFKELLQYMAAFYREHKDQIIAQNQALMSALQQLSSPKINENITLNITPLIKIRDEIASDYDRINGGFGDAPKFPHPSFIEILLQSWISSKKQDHTALAMAENTLIKMAQGGIYDQLGGGFYRYSVDAEWQIPHFEKMLYDNAQLLCQYAYAYSATKNDLYKNISTETGAWILREMQAPEGGYYATIDADSEGKEGKFYVWSQDEAKQLLSPQEYKIMSSSTNLDDPPNFESHWHLHITHTLEEVAHKNNLSKEETKKLFLSAKHKLFNAREQRIKPHSDEKILTAWNGLMIKGMTLAGIQLQKPEFIASAEKALNFIYHNLWQHHRLLASYKDGRATLAAYLDDHVFLIDGILTFLQYRWNSNYFQFACELADLVLKHFFDSEQGGFFYMADDHEKLIYRPKNLADEAIPAGNGIAAYVLQRLGFMLGNSHYLDAVEKTFKMAWQNLEKYPIAHATLQLALAEFLEPPKIIFIRGKAQNISNWQELCLRDYHLHLLVFAIPDTEMNLPPAIADKKSSGNVLAYVCQGTQCSPPFNDLDEFNKLLF